MFYIIHAFTPRTYRFFYNINKKCINCSIHRDGVNQSSTLSSLSLIKTLGQSVTFLNLGYTHVRLERVKPLSSFQVYCTMFLDAVCLITLSRSVMEDLYVLCIRYMYVISIYGYAIYMLYIYVICTLCMYLICTYYMYIELYSIKSCRARCGSVFIYNKLL